MKEKKIKKNCLRDVDIRSALLACLSKKHAAKTNTIFIEELGVCQGRSRADVVVVNGLLHGYEIKSDCDSLHHLRNQINFYGKVFDCATLVVGKRLFSQAVEIIPNWWSIILAQTCSTGLHLSFVRSIRDNPGRDPRALVELLWRKDAILFLEERNAARGVRSKPRRFVWDRVCENFSLEEIAERTRVVLKDRVENGLISNSCGFFAGRKGSPKSSYRRRGRQGC